MDGTDFNHMPDIALDTFIANVFENHAEDEHPLLALQQGQGFSHAPAAGKNASRWMRGNKKAVYFNVSTVRKPEPDEDGALYWQRYRRHDLDAFLEERACRSTSMTPGEQNRTAGAGEFGHVR